MSQQTPAPVGPAVPPARPSTPSERPAPVPALLPISMAALAVAFVVWLAATIALADAADERRVAVRRGLDADLDRLPAVALGFEPGHAAEDAMDATYAPWWARQPLAAGAGAGAVVFCLGCIAVLTVNSERRVADGRRPVEPPV